MAKMPDEIIVTPNMMREISSVKVKVIVPLKYKLSIWLGLKIISFGYWLIGFAPKIEFIDKDS